MAAQLYLITPPVADTADLPAQVMSLLSAAEFSALLVRRGPLDDKAYADLAAKLINIGQGAGCAVLVEDDVALAKRLRADGVHVGTSLKAAREAIAALKPDLIVGAGPFTNRHDAMSVGELDVDYVLFGALDGASDPAAADLAAWWAETFEVPAVFSDPGATAETADSQGAEFVALSTSAWAGGKAITSAIAARLGEEA
jgi:thiamine-phosphate pyrophosphorylase